MTDPLEALMRLGDDIRRAQTLTGIAPRAPATSVYEQDHGPRAKVAKQRLAELGYEVEEPGAASQFRKESAIPASAGGAPAVDPQTWGALDELRGFEAEIDLARWRDRRGVLLPAMRRAILARIAEVTLPKPLSMKVCRGGAPSVERTRKALRRCAFMIPSTRDLDDRELEDEIVPLILSQRRMWDVARSEFIAKTAIGKVFQEIASKRERLFLGLEEGRGPFPPKAGESLGAQLFRDLTERPELSRRPRDEETRRLWPEVLALFGDPEEIEERWREITAKPERMWSGLNRAKAWLSGSARWFEERGRSLHDGLREVGRVDGGTAKATQIKLFQILYHDLAEAFEAIHLGAECFVTLTRDAAGEVGPIRVRQTPAGIQLFVDREAQRGDIDRARDRLQGEARIRSLTFQLLGIAVNVTLGWPVGGALHVGVVISSLAQAAPRLIALGRELSAAVAAAQEAAEQPSEGSATKKGSTTRKTERTKKGAAEKKGRRPRGRPGSRRERRERR